MSSARDGRDDVGGRVDEAVNQEVPVHVASESLGRVGETNTDQTSYIPGPLKLVPTGKNVTNPADKTFAAIATSKPLSRSTIGEVIDFQPTLRQYARAKYGQNTSAVGKYQVVEETLERHAKKVFGSDWRNTVFSEANQDKIGESIYEESKQKGSTPKKIWAGLAKLEGRPGYEWVGKARGFSEVDWPTARDALLPLESGSGKIKEQNTSAKNTVADKHIIRKGDTLWKLAEHYGFSEQSLRDANPGINSRSLRIGQLLNLPNSQSKKVDSLITEAIGDKPQVTGSEAKHLSVAKKYLGKHEISDRSLLRKFLGVDPKETPWCAAFVNAVLKEAGGGNGTGKLNARSFLNFGKETNSPKIGDIVVLERGGKNSWQGHVGFFQGYDKNGNIKVLGGNQGNKVSIASYPKEKLLGFRTW